MELFRQNSQADDIELTEVQDVELSNLLVRIQFTHDFPKHLDRKMELSSKQENIDDLFLRSSSTSTHEHILVFKE